MIVLNYIFIKKLSYYTTTINELDEIIKNNKHTDVTKSVSSNIKNIINIKDKNIRSLKLKEIKISEDLVKNKEISKDDINAIRKKYESIIYEPLREINIYESTNDTLKYFKPSFDEKNINVEMINISDELAYEINEEIYKWMIIDIFEEMLSSTLENSTIYISNENDILYFRYVYKYKILEPKLYNHKVLNIQKLFDMCFIQNMNLKIHSEGCLNKIIIKPSKKTP